MTTRPGDASADGGDTHSLLFDVFVLGQAVAELLAVAMADSPLTPGEYARYSVVFEEEAVTPTTMARRLSMPLTTVVDDLRHMEARGHLRRIPNPGDGRSYMVTLSADGLRAHREANRRFEIAYARFTAELGIPPAVARGQLRSLIAAVRRATKASAVDEQVTRSGVVAGTGSRQRIESATAIVASRPRADSSR